MRRERFGRGGSRNGRGRGNGGGYRGGGGGGNRRRRGGRSRHHGPRAGAESGNQRERIAIESGYLVLIDQFMLANPQFIERLPALVDAEPAAKDELIEEFGGSVVQLEPGTYRIERDPFAFSIVVHPEGKRMTQEELTEQAKDTSKRVYVDTRCLAMIDRELLDDASLLEKYQQLWFSGQDKACRDLLRDNGGAVRYGFQRNGDELGIYLVTGEDVLCLWPDAVEAVADAEQGEDAQPAVAAE
jgi:hypothetical protein